ncbi:hypothetical protein BC936DRAFT_146997 [Jimgerdemannia flammicorona]|uniref:Golgi apparatus membrane protein TVP38 n=1 Tax=Jimgerdemannia flammicorona TaxID=994334 RepID=A0A433D6C8_9FUNG|nr:hypothetical protein BC936DRAFT_146997 [Jimgerdemannia flammicorona]
MAKGFWGKAVTGIVALIVVTCIVLFFVFNKPIMEAVQPFAEQLRQLPGGYVILAACITITSIPPLVGYESSVSSRRNGVTAFMCNFIFHITYKSNVVSVYCDFDRFTALCYVSGFVYGFPMGMFPTVGGKCEFRFLGVEFLEAAQPIFFVSDLVDLTPHCRRLFRSASLVRIFKWTKYVERFTKSDDRYLAMEEAVEEGGFGIILLIRLSPIPFSIQNAFFAIIPKVKFWQFGLATLLAVWKLVVDVWIGSTLANLADPKLDPTARAVSYAYIGGGVLFLAVAMWWIYRVTMRKVRAMALRRESKLASAQGAERNFVAEPMLRDGSRSPYEDEEFAVGGSNSNANITKPERVVLEEVEPYDERIMTPVSHIP